MNRVGVVMIVRNEAGRVGRALESVRDATDTWLVIDTGSTDETIDEIHTVTSGWPGLLLHRPWVNFGENRSELVRTAQDCSLAKWLLTIDADHVVEEADHVLEAVDQAEEEHVDALLLPFTSVPLLWVPRLIKTDLPWRYIGVTKEYLWCDKPFEQRKTDVPRIHDYSDGASRENKWSRDVELLREELAAHPDHARSWYSLGESYRGLRQYEAAAAAFTNCALKTKFSEERYLALTLSGEMLIAQGETKDGLARLLIANEERPQRREALLMACQVLNKQKRYREVLALLSGGDFRRPIPADDLVAIIPDAYGPAMARELAIAKSRR
jgi:glycosyltransferase involved in cell wall biosynthesis